MLISQTSFLGALHWWSFERIADASGKISAPEETQISMHRIRTIVPFLFQAINSLYIATRRIPTPWTTNTEMPVKTGGTRGLYISLNIDPENYLLLRAILALTGDVHLCCKSLTTHRLLELKAPVKKLLVNTKDFYEVRSFFTHFDEVLSTPLKHGISGATKTNCGIEYTSSAKECRHLVLVRDKIHFSYRQRAAEADISKSAFNAIFESARLIYTEVISHKVHAQTCHYLHADKLYPL